MLIITFTAVLILWFLIFNKLLLVSVNHLLAKSRGINVYLYEYIFTMVMAIIVSISIQWVGILIISSLLVIPAAAARNIAQNMKQYHIFSILICVVSGLSGLILSYFWGTASGATIILVAAIFYMFTFLIKLKHG